MAKRRERRPAVRRRGRPRGSRARGGPDFFTPWEAAGVLRCSLPTIRRAIRSGALPAVRVGTRVWRIPKNALAALDGAQARSVA